MTEPQAIAETPLAHLRTLENELREKAARMSAGVMESRRAFTRSGVSNELSPLFYPLVDSLADNAVDLRGFADRLRRLLTDLEAAQRKEKEAITRVETGATMPVTGSTAQSANGSSALLGRMLTALHLPSTYDEHSLLALLLAYQEDSDTVDRQEAAGEVVASRPSEYAANECCPTCGVVLPCHVHQIPHPRAGELLTHPAVASRPATQEPEFISALVTKYQSELNAAWSAIEHGWDIESRQYFEREAPKNGFRYPLVQAIHHLWKRETRPAAAAPAVEVARRMQLSKEAADLIYNALPPDGDQANDARRLLVEASHPTGIPRGRDDDKAETYRQGWEAGHADGLAGRAGGREDALLTELVHAAGNFVAMVEGESPSLVEDDHNHARLVEAIRQVRAALHARPASPLETPTGEPS